MIPLLFINCMNHINGANGIDKYFDTVIENFISNVKSDVISIALHTSTRYCLDEYVCRIPIFVLNDFNLRSVIQCVCKHLKDGCLFGVLDINSCTALRIIQFIPESIIIFEDFINQQFNAIKNVNLYNFQYQSGISNKKGYLENENHNTVNIHCWNKNIDIDSILPLEALEKLNVYMVLSFYLKNANNLSKSNNILIIEAKSNDLKELIDYQKNLNYTTNSMITIYYIISSKEQLYDIKTDDIYFANRVIFVYSKEILATLKLKNLISAIEELGELVKETELQEDKINIDLKIIRSARNAISKLHY